MTGVVGHPVEGYRHVGPHHHDVCYNGIRRIPNQVHYCPMLTEEPRSTATQLLTHHNMIMCTGVVQVAL